MTIPGWALEHVAVTGLLIVAVAALCRLFSNRPALQHALWLVVLAKFVVPPWMVWPLPVPDWIVSRSTAVELASLPTETNLASERDEPVAEPTVEPSDAAINEPMDELVRAVITSGQPIVVPLEEPVAASPVSPPVPLLRPLPVINDQSRAGFAAEITFDRLFYAGWLIGGLVAAWRRFTQIARFRRMTNRATAAPDHLRAETVRLAAILRLRPVPVLVTDEISSPLVWCLGRAKLIWPAALSDSANLDRWKGVLCHELAHVRRLDHWTAWLELAVGLVWWWNPLAWFVVRRVRDSAELACDAMVINVLPDERRAYAEIFLELSGTGRQSEPTPALGARSRNRKTFERRLAMILSQRVRSNVSLPGLAVAFGLAVVAIPSWSLSHADQPAAFEEKLDKADPVAAGEDSAATAPEDSSDSSQEADPSDPFADSGDKTALPTVETGASKTSTVVEMEAFLYMPTLFARPYDKITRVQIDQPDVLSVTPRTQHELQFLAKKVGTCKVTMWCGGRELTTLQVNTLLGAIAVPDKSTPSWANAATDVDMVVDAFVNMPTIETINGEPIKRVEVDHPDILSVTLKAGNKLEILAKKIGTATFDLWGEERDGSAKHLVKVQINALPVRRVVSAAGAAPSYAPAMPGLSQAARPSGAPGLPPAQAPAPGGPQPARPPAPVAQYAPAALPPAATPPITPLDSPRPIWAAVAPAANLGPDVIGRFEGEVQISIDPDLRPDTKFELFRYGSIIFRCPDHNIDHVKVSDEDVLLVRNQTASGFRVSGKKVGTGKIALFDGVAQFGSVEIVVLAPPTVAAPTLPPTYVLSSPPVAVPPTVAAAADSADEEREHPSRMVAKSGQIDAAGLGIAMIEAQSALELAQTEFDYTKSLHDKKAISANELRLREIKLATAQQKVQFLERLARAAYEAAQHELDYQMKVFGRASTLAKNGSLNQERYDQAQRELNAAKDKVALLRTIPGVKTPKATDAPVKAD